jgi:hypothetical protein
MKSLSLGKFVGRTSDKGSKNSNIPNQFTRLKNVAKGEDVIKDDKNQT